jgi:hypothetical protein
VERTHEHCKTDHEDMPTCTENEAQATSVVTHVQPGFRCAVAAPALPWPPRRRACSCVGVNGWTRGGTSRVTHRHPSLECPSLTSLLQPMQCAWDEGERRRGSIKESVTASRACGVDNTLAMVFPLEHSGRCTHTPHTLYKLVRGDGVCVCVCSCWISLMAPVLATFRSATAMIS